VIPTERFEQVEVSSPSELAAWLEAHHGQDESVWLVTFKKAVPARYVSRDQVLDLLVAYDWIDGIRRQVDEQRTMQLIGPRRTKPWARTYKDRAERLIAAGEMRPSGMAAVEAAKASGDWDAMNDVDDLLVPSDLAERLASVPMATERFTGFPPSTRRNILRWLASAKTEPTRLRRIGRITEDAAQGIRTPSNG
jgi:uncharacterized protein YdeI (YjbR/CyaY-like superfamily)